MELQAEAASGDERLRADVGLGDHRRSRRRGERVEVPLEPRALGHQLRVGAAHRQPADLGPRAAEHLAAEHPGQHLAAEAEAEHGDVRVDGSAHETRLARHERLRVVERRELRAERDDEVVLGGVDLAVVDVDPERLDDRPVRVEPLGDESRGRGLLVLEDQRAQRAVAVVVELIAYLRWSTRASDSSGSTLLRRPRGPLRRTGRPSPRAPRRSW